MEIKWQEKEEIFEFGPPRRYKVLMERTRINEGFYTEWTEVPTVPMEDNNDK